MSKLLISTNKTLILFTKKFRKPHDLALLPFVKNA